MDIKADILKGHFKGGLWVLRTKSNCLEALNVLSLQRVNLTNTQTARPSQQAMHFKEESQTSTATSLGPEIAFVHTPINSKSGLA